jgi:hypothetical protein
MSAHDQFETGDLVWTLALNANLGWSVEPALVTDIATDELLICGNPRKDWSQPWFKTEDEAKAELNEKLANTYSMKDILSVQPMTAPVGDIFYMDYDYTYKKDDTDDE